VREGLTSLESKDFNFLAKFTMLGSLCRVSARVYTREMVGDGNVDDIDDVRDMKIGARNERRD
jgi:hypothetical protein